MTKHYHLRGLYILLILLLSACEGDRTNTHPVAEVGTRAFLLFGGNPLAMDITGIEGEIVRTAVSVDQDIVSLRDYYRGLLPVSGTRGGRSFYFTFDPDDLLSIFPLTLGKSISFSGILTVDSEALPVSVTARINVLGKGNFTLATGIEPVKIIQVEWNYKTNIWSKSVLDTYYYSENLGFNLKFVSGTGRNPDKWYVTDIVKPGVEQDNRNLRRPGTVMI